MLYVESVTEILDRYIDKSWFKDEDRERGKLIHARCAIYSQGFFAPTENELSGYFLSFTKWFDSMVEEVVLVEERLFDNDLGISGQPDLVAKLKGDTGNTLIDYKSGQKNKLYLIQRATYKHLAEKNGIPIARTGILYLNKDGRMAKFDDRDDDSAMYFGVFQNMLAVKRFLDK